MKLLILARCHTCGLTLFFEPDGPTVTGTIGAPYHPHIGCPQDGNLLSLTNGKGRP